MNADAGGPPVQMTYSSFPSSAGGIGLPAAGFASRGKGNGLKRLSLASPPKVGSISENPTDGPTPTPRTSRSYLLQGLRTAPKQQTTASAPSSAPHHMSHHSRGLASSKFAPQSNTVFGNVPHTAIGSGFTGVGQQFSLSPGQQFYALPEQVLAPPPLELDESDEQMDPNLLAQLYATEVYLAQRQQQLQQQLANLTAQQFAGMSVGQGNRQTQSSYPQTPVTPQLGIYGAPNTPAGIQEVPGQPGVYQVFNPLTGTVSYVVDPNAQQQSDLANSPPPPTPSHVSTFSNDFRSETASPFEGNGSLRRSMSPPKTSTPDNFTNGSSFRRGHNRKNSSLALNNANGTPVSDGPKSAFVQPVGMPQTPLTGTFGPGQARAGEHPTRQPRGPPAFEELKARPTTKHEGSKNFVTRQRRQAVHSLVRAGLERRVVRPGSASAGSMTPVSDPELTFSVPSDNDSDSGRSGHGTSGSLSGKPSIGSLRAVANGAIGSERKEKLASGKDADAESDDGKSLSGQRRRTPLLVLANAAEKRMTSGVAAA